MFTPNGTGVVLHPSVFDRMQHPHRSKGAPATTQLRRRHRVIELVESIFKEGVG